LKIGSNDKSMITNNFHLSLLLLFLDPGSGMGKNQDLGSGINIPDPQHWYNRKQLIKTYPNKFRHSDEIMLHYEITGLDVI